MHTPFLVKLAIVAMLVAIVASLAVGLLRLRRDRGRTTGTVKALTVRVVLSIVLLLLLAAGLVAGVIVPHGVTP